MNTNHKDIGETRIPRIKANYTPKAFGVPFVPIRLIRVLFFVFFVPLCFLIFGCDSKPPQTARSNKAPDFTLPAIGWSASGGKDLSGKEVKLADLLGQKPLVLDFWASWCPSCRAEIPKIVELYNNYKDKINVVGINLDRSLSDAQAYTQKNFIHYPNLYDARGMVARTYRVVGIPALVIINSQGEIVNRNATLEDVKALIK